MTSASHFALLLTVAIAFSAACAGSESVDGAGGGGWGGAAGSDAGSSGGTAGSSSGGGSGSGGAANGTPCSASSECKSLWCADGFCCDGDCSGPCRTCKAAGKEGTCSFALAGTDPELECGTAGEPCSGKCDGAGACAYPSTEKLCGAVSCTNGTQTAEACDGAGACKETQTSCGFYLCAGSACLTSCNSDADCDTAAWCNAGSCEIKKSDGASCTAKNECQSDVCASGYCCNVACDAPSSCSTGQCLCDGKTCATGKKCVTWYADVDKDGHGDKSKPKLGCEGTGPNDGNTYALDGDDCYDANANAKPGQTAFFTVDRGDGSFDYNCNLAKELEYPDATGLPCGDCGAQVGQFCYSCGVLPNVNTYGMGCTPANKCTTTGLLQGYDKTVDCGQQDYLYSCGMCSTTKVKDTVPTKQGCH